MQSEVSEGWNQACGLCRVPADHAPSDQGRRVCLTAAKHYSTYLPGVTFHWMQGSAIEDLILSLAFGISKVADDRIISHDVPRRRQTSHQASTQTRDVSCQARRETLCRRAARRGMRVGRCANESDAASRRVADATGSGAAPTSRTPRHVASGTPPKPALARPASPRSEVRRGLRGAHAARLYLLSPTRSPSPSWRPAAGFPGHHSWRKGILLRAAAPRTSAAVRKGDGAADDNKGVGASPPRPLGRSALARFETWV